MNDKKYNRYAKLDIVKCDTPEKLEIIKQVLSKDTDKEKQIKEMVEHIKKVIYNTEPDFNGYRVPRTVELAEELLKYYQPKIPENAVVLTREEYDDMYSFKTTRGGFYNILDTVRKVERKETAKEILQDFDNHGVYSKDYTNFMRKEFGVEVE